MLSNNNNRKKCIERNKLLFLTQQFSTGITGMKKKIVHVRICEKANAAEKL